MAEASLSADNGILAVGIVAAALIVILIRPANITLNQEQEQSQQQTQPGGGSSDPFAAIAKFIGL